MNGAPQLVGDDGGQALLDEEVNPAAFAVLRQEGDEVSFLRANVAHQRARPLQYPAVGAAPVLAQQLAEQGQHVKKAAGKLPGLPLEAVQVGQPLEEDNPQEVAPLQPAAHPAAPLFPVQKEAPDALPTVHETYDADEALRGRQRWKSLRSPAGPSLNGMNFWMCFFTTRCVTF